MAVAVASTAAAAGADTAGENGGDLEESGGEICAAARVEVVEQGRHGRQGEADTTEAEASAGVGKGN